MEVDYAAMGSRVRRLRLAQHMTQEQLAEACNISFSFLGHIERGTRKMSLETLAAHMSRRMSCSSARPAMPPGPCPACWRGSPFGTPLRRSASAPPFWPWSGAWTPSEILK